MITFRNAPTIVGIGLVLMVCFWAVQALAVEIYPMTEQAKKANAICERNIRKYLPGDRDDWEPGDWTVWERCLNKEYRWVLLQERYANEAAEAAVEGR